MNDKPNADNQTPQEAAALEASRKIKPKCGYCLKPLGEGACKSKLPNSPIFDTAVCMAKWEAEQPEPQPEVGGDMVTVSRKSNHKLLNKNLALAQENADLRETIASQQRELEAVEDVLNSVATKPVRTHYDRNVDYSRAYGEWELAERLRRNIAAAKEHKAAGGSNE